MQRIGGAAAVLRFAFAQRHGFALEFADKTRTLQRTFVEQSFKLAIFHRFRRLTKTFLSVLQCFDEIINCRYGFLLLCHTHVSHAVRDSRSFLPARLESVFFFMNKKGKDLTKEPPRSPKTQVGGYAILGRTIDKCRALLWGNIGEYHFDCPLDNMLFGFKGVKGNDFKAFVETGASDEDIAKWLDRNGIPKSAEEKRVWSEEMLKVNYYDNPEKRDWYVRAIETARSRS